MAEALFEQEIKNETGIAFGPQGTDFLGVAIERAAAEGRTVAVVSALNLATVKPYEGRIAGSKKVNGHNALQAFMSAARNAKNLPSAIVFHGIEEYARLTMIEIVGSTATPTQQQWGDLGRIVSNDLRELGAIWDVLYVTCDVVQGDDDKPKINLNPNARDIILGGLLHKLYVGRRREGDDFVTVVQEDPQLSLAFVLPKRETVEGEAGATPRRGLGSKR